MGDTGNVLVATVFLRLVLPLVLTACIAVRPSGLSALYLLLYAYLPFVPNPTSRTVKGHLGRFLKLTLLVTFSTVIGQIVFQIVLLSLPPYGSFLQNCSLLETILRHVGFVRLNNLSVLDILRWTVPDALSLLTAIATHILSSNVETTTSKNSKILKSVGAYLTLAVLLFTSSLIPSIPNFFYYFVFLFGATSWALKIDIKNKCFAVVLFFLYIFVFTHVVAILGFQVQYGRDLIPQAGLIQRLAGLEDYYTDTSCVDPRVLALTENKPWTSYVHPICLMLLLHLFIYEAKTLLRPEEKYIVLSKRRMGGSTTGGRLGRRQTVRWHGKSRRLSLDLGDSDDKTEETPLMVTAPRTRYGSSGGRSHSGPLESEVLSRGQSVTSRDSCAVESSGQSHTGEETGEYDGYTILITGLFSVFDLFAKSSYIATNIIMMAWSITYHSWLTFVLLLWACVLWMFPNQRKAMLFSSPGLVIYAELLLLAQYVFSLDLTDQELPNIIDGVNMAEIGLVKVKINACYPILVKSLYTLMFWITLRQFVMERKERKATIEDAAQESFRITVTTTTAGTAISELRQAEERAEATFMVKLGNFVKDVMTKFWIWVVAIMLFVIGLGGEKVVLYRIVYMALFLVFILTFQLSYDAWRKMMYGFWLTVIVYSMLVLVLIYTYQFEDIPQYLSNYTGIPDQLQKDIGLEKYDTGSLFVRLLTPTFFVVITVVQLHYFHKDFLKLSEMRRPIGKKVETVEEDQTAPKTLIDELTIKNLIDNVTFYSGMVLRLVLLYYNVFSEITWRFLEIHICKIVLFSALLLTVYDKCALHVILFVGVVNGLCLRAGFQKLVMHISSIYISLLLLVKMIYQIDYIDHSSWDTNCTDGSNITNDAVWLGLHKSDDLPDLLSGYIGMILVLTVQAVVNIRQQYERYMLDRVEPIPGILFPDVQRPDADKGILLCIQFLLNHGFHKFGVEITLVTLVSVIGTRLDLFSVLYSFWLIPLFSMRRHKIAKIWTSFILFVAILLPVQYLACVGLPPFLCTDYPWTNIDKQLKGWLFLPDEHLPPYATRLIPDFFLLLVACQQKLVFRRNHIEDFPGGSNEEVPETVEINPVPDFLSNRNPILLDMMKKCVFLYFYWITLGMMFLAGTNRVNLFALGYLVGSFIFLWEGNEFYLRDKISIVKRWNYLLAYNVFVIFLKSFLQLVGCVFLYSLQGNFCWFVQLCGIACLNKFSGENSASLNQGILRGDKDSFDAECKVPHDEAGLVWDGVTFAFLIFQRRIFNSFYFFHIRKETEVQAQLASRGAELIEELMQKQIKQQEDIEKEVLEKIKMKMDRIKATHQKGQRPKGPQNHFDAIRSGDYYMFDENDDDDLEMIDSITEEEDEDEDRERPPGVTLSELMSSALKSDMESAAEMARMARRQSEVKDLSFAESQGSRRVRRRRFSKRSAMSFRSSAIKKESSDAPLALSDDEKEEDKDDKEEEGGGGDGGGDSEQKEESKANLVRKAIGYIRFGWAFCESVMISATAWLNKFSKDYRHVSMKLAQERLLLKSSQDPLKEFRKSELSVDLVSRKSTEESDLAGSADDLDSKDDLQTVVEKEFRTSDSLDDLSLSEMPEHCPFVLLIVAVWYVVISHSDLVCYFIVFLNQIKSASLLSLPLPLMVLLWGSLSVPRPTKTFWVTVIAYTEALVVIKYLFQFDFFPWNEKAKQVKTGPFWPPKILGIEQSDKYAVYDVLLLMAVFFHRFMLKSLGLWKNKPETPKDSEDDEEIMTIEEVKASTTLEEMSSQEKSLSEGPSEEIRCARAKVLLQELQYFDPQVIKLCFDKYLSSIKTFFNQILNLEYKVKSDVYSYMFMCDFFNFLVVIFGFASFGSQTGDVSSYLEENKVPVPFLVMVILQFGLIVVDRALYLRKYILGKFFFQIFLATLVHVAMFFVLPAVTEREFNAATPPQMWYMVKCIYLLFSAYQIRSGYPTRILGNFLCKKYNYVNMFLFKGFMAVPFLFELRALMDWIWTDTSMTLSDWLKLEDIFANIFQLKCQRRVEKEYPQERGVSKSRWSKYTIGGSSLFTVIAIIWFPLVLFALGNTVGLPNQPTDISLEITVGSYQPIFTMSVQNNSIDSFSEGNWNHFKDYIYRLDKVGQNFLGTYEHDDVVRAKLSGNSSSIWSISPPARDKIMQELLSNDTMTMRISWTINRKDANPTVTPIARGNDEVSLGVDERRKFVKMINRTGSDPVEIKSIFPKFLKVQNNGKATVARQLTKGLLDQNWSYNWEADKTKQAVLRNLTMTLKNSSEVVWWEVEEKCTQTEKSNDLPLGDKCQHLNLYIFNEKAFPPTLSFISGGGIISLYTTLVLVASKFVRGFFSGISFQIMFDDMPNVDRIFQLCLDIYLVRESGELALEEDLFAKLIFLYRSPETLIKWTRPKTVRPSPE